MATACMKESDSTTRRAWVAAMEASPILTTIAEKAAKEVISRHHCPPIGSPVRSSRRAGAQLGVRGRVSKWWWIFVRETKAKRQANWNHSEAEVANPAP